MQRFLSDFNSLTLNIMAKSSNPSPVLARNDLRNLLLSKCSGGRGRPPLPGSTLRPVGKVTTEAVATVAQEQEEQDVKRNHVSKIETNGGTGGEKETKHCSEDDNNLLKDKEDEDVIKSELCEAIQLLKNARGSLELLKEIYAKRNQEKMDGMETLSFSSMKKLYGAKIVEYGGLAERHRKIKTEVKTLHKSNANMRWELDQMRGPRVQDNPWINQAAMPYGFHGNGRRDGSRREGDERRDRSRARR